MAFRKKPKRSKAKRAKVTRETVDARPLVQIDLPDKKWKQKLRKAKGAIVKLTVETTPELLEHARVAIGEAAQLAREAGAVHVVVHPPKVKRGKEKKGARSNVARLTPADAVKEYMERHPPRGVDAGVVRKTAARLLREAR